MKKVIVIIAPIFIAIFVFVLFQFVANNLSGKGALQVTSSPSSSVYVDNKYLGVTPLCKCKEGEMLPEGEHTIRMVPKDPSLSPFEANITITKKALTVVDRTFGKAGLSQGSIITLTPNYTKSAQLTVLSDTSGANVSLDSNSVGNTPLYIKSTTESDHELKITKPGYLEEILRVHTVEGYTLTAKVYLSVDPTALSPTPTKTSTPTPVSTRKVVISQTPTGFLRVHQSSSLDSPEVAEIHPGETYTLLSQTPGWYQIQVNATIIGWISSDYATIQ